MSRDNPVRRPRHRVWSFSHTLCTSILPEATSGFHRTSTIDPVVLIHRLFDNLFKDCGRPVFYIHLRVTRAAFDLCVECGKTGAALPDLPFAGFIQAKSLLGLNNLQRWLDATWRPRRGGATLTSEGASGAASRRRCCWCCPGFGRGAGTEPPDVCAGL